MESKQIRATKPTDNTGGLSPGIRDPYTRLAAGILANGASAAKAGDQGAAQWLLSEQAEFLADSIGLSHPHVRKWVHNFERQNS